MLQPSHLLGDWQQGSQVAWKQSCSAAQWGQLRSCMEQKDCLQVLKLQTSIPCNAAFDSLLLQNMQTVNSVTPTACVRALSHYKVLLSEQYLAMGKCKQAYSRGQRTHPAVLAPGWVRGRLCRAAAASASFIASIPFLQHTQSYTHVLKLLR